MADEPLNGGHRFALQIGSDNYYYADAVRFNEYGFPEWFCQYPDHNRLGRKTENCIVLDYQAKMSLEEFKGLAGQIE